MKSAKFTMYLACLVGLMLTSMSAQTGGIRAKIPFDFNTGEQMLLAGDYKVTVEGKVLHIARLDGPGFAFVPIYSYGYNKDASPKLVFHRYGAHNFLTEAWIAASVTSCGLHHGNSKLRRRRNRNGRLSLPRPCPNDNRHGHGAKPGHFRVLNSMTTSYLRCKRKEEEKGEI